MIKEKMLQDFLDKIPNEGEIFIFGACKIGEKILKDLEIYKPNVKIVGFIDNKVTGSFDGLPVQSLKNFVKNENKPVIMSTKNDERLILNIFDLYNIPAVQLTEAANHYYRYLANILNDENYKKIINIFDKREDRHLFDLIFKTRIKLSDSKEIENFYYTHCATKYKVNRVYKKQYLDKINQNTIKTLFDAGFYDGTNVIAYNRLLPHLEKICGFEAIYDITRNPLIEEFILDKKLEIIPYVLGNKNEEIKFCLEKDNLGASFCEGTSTKKISSSIETENRIVNMITLDKFCFERNIFPDFIKMDIEGAELSALNGGIKTIKKCRPQLAISIYHSSEDFVNIPLYLKENLENYKFRLGHYSPNLSETVLYAIPDELA